MIPMHPAKHLRPTQSVLDYLPMSTQLECLLLYDIVTQPQTKTPQEQMRHLSYNQLLEVILFRGNFVLKTKQLLGDSIATSVQNVVSSLVIVRS